MKTKIEHKIDMELEKLGVKTYIYHIREYVWPFSGVTIALPNRDNSYKEVYELVRGRGAYIFEPASQLKSRLEAAVVVGIAICDGRDQYNKRIGRIIAKGRLLKALKKKNGEK